MLKHVLKGSCLWLCAAASQPVAAQMLFNSTHGNFSGLNEANWNPAAIADSRLSFEFRLLALDGHATNSAYRYTGPWRLGNLNESFSLSARDLTLQENSRPKLVSVGLNVRGPGVMLRLSPRHSVALSVGARAALQGNQVSQELVRSAVDQFETAGAYTNNTANFNINAFSEWNATYARVLLDQQTHVLKAGITVKRLMGIGSAYLQSKQFDYTTTPANRNTQLADTVVHLDRLDGSFGYSNPDAFRDLDAGTVRRWLTPGSSPGAGWGLDVGVVYEYRPNSEQYRYQDKKGAWQTDYGHNKYRYRLAVALTDIGSIRYRKQAVVYNDIRRTNLGINSQDINDITLDNYNDQLEKIFQIQPQNRDNAFRAALPTTLNIDLDYHLLWKLYANASLSQGLRGRYAVGMRRFSYAALTPRLEMRWLEVAMPLSLTNSYQDFAYGLVLRAGPLTIGSNNLPALFRSTQPYGANLFGELTLALANKRHKLRTPAANP
ncbi:DUF5723 family protein [Hymenobacter profundi]|uniref:DUF5723 domain-containing protein n=1 Tax=Hymenobacter profundi TaxID=1982110 RepID=A0ABS6WZH5_9BACT|nr:DUF5723 family protein [Hymenobacter profundi]MBW3128627.1 hypothetical protein [Hymenobacter profundi]